MNSLDTSPDRVRAEQLQRLQMEAQRLAACAEKNGFGLTVRVEPGQIQVIDVRETRSSAEDPIAVALAAKEKL